MSELPNIKGKIAKSLRDLKIEELEAKNIELETKILDLETTKADFEVRLLDLENKEVK